MGLLDQLQTELEAEAPGTVALLAVNVSGGESGNPLALPDLSVPLLQDVPEVNAWATWGVAWRDVVLVDTSGVGQGAFNLTSHDLREPKSYALLKQLLLTLP